MVAPGVAHSRVIRCVTPKAPGAGKALGVAAWWIGELVIGKVRSIGVSNFKPAHLDRLLAEATLRPVANQIQLNPRITRPEHVAYDRAHDIVTVAWSPLGQGSDLLNEQTLATIAARYGKTPAQVILRWDIDLGIVAIPRSSNPGRLAQNLDIFDFTLTADEIAAISALDTGAEKRADSDTGGH